MRGALGAVVIIFPLVLALTVLTLLGHADVAWGIGVGAAFSFLVVGCILGGIEIILRSKR